MSTPRPDRRGTPVSTLRVDDWMRPAERRALWMASGAAVLILTFGAVACAFAARCALRDVSSLKSQVSGLKLKLDRQVSDFRFRFLFVGVVVVLAPADP